MSTSFDIRNSALGISPARLLGELIATISLTAASEGEKTHRSAGKAEVRMQKGKSNIPLHPSSFILQTFPMLAPYKGRIYDPACGSGGIAFTFTTFMSTDPQPKQIAA